MGDYFEEWFDSCMEGVEACFNAFWDASEGAIEVALNESGKSLESFAGWYKDKVVSEYKLAYQSIMDDRKKMAEKINAELLKEPDEKKKQKIKDKLRKTDELKKKREKKLEEKKADQLKKLDRVREKRLKKLRGA